MPTVKAQMAQLFKLDDAKLAAVFSGKPVVLKRDCDITTAEKLKAALTKAGADSEIKPSAAATAQPVSPPKPAPPASPVPAVSAAAMAAPKSVVLAPVPSAHVVAAAVSAGMKLAPVGPVMSETERAALRKVPVQVKTDHIVLEKRASSFGGADEKPAVSTRPEIKAPDFGVLPAGGDLLKENEKRVYETLEIDLSAFEVAELGADMLSEEEKLPLPVMDIEELDVDLAPVGSDMAQLKKPAPPAPPKTDHLTLA